MASYLLISAAQCRAARGLLGWTQQDLATATGLSKTAIVQFETGLTRARDDTLAQISISLIRHGIEFTVPEGVNLRSATSQLFADEKTLQDEWPAFLKSFSPHTVIQLINWPDFAAEFSRLTGRETEMVTLDGSTLHQAAFIGEWLVMPLLDTPFRIAVYTGQWRRHINAA